MTYQETIELLNKKNRTLEEKIKLSNNRTEILRLLFKDADENTYERIVNIIVNHNFLSNFLEDLYFFQPLSKVVSKDGWKEKPISERKLNNAARNERLVALNRYDKLTGQFIQLHPQIFVYPQYFIDGRKGTFPEIYVREGVLESILSRLELLPEGYSIMVYDGFRTFECQKDIYDEIFAEKFQEESIKSQNKDKTTEEIKAYVKDKIMPNYVSYPSFDPPSTHNTGGALDSRICDENGIVLNYGCKFDEFESVASVDYFDKKLQANEYLTEKELEAMLIRRVTTNFWKYPVLNLTYGFVGRKIYNSFVEFAGEDWHVDINNQWDSELHEAIYGSCEVDGIIPDPNYTVEDYQQERKKIFKVRGS